MAKRTRPKGKRSEEGQYIPLPYAQLKSPAWRSLSGAAVKVWLELHTRYNGGNNGNVRLSMNEAVSALGIGKGTAQRAFLELQEKGFIALVVSGNCTTGAPMSGALQPSKWTRQRGGPRQQMSGAIGVQKQNTVSLRTRHLVAWVQLRTQSRIVGPYEYPSG